MSPDFPLVLEIPAHWTDADVRAEVADRSAEGWRVDCHDRMRDGRRLVVMRRVRAGEGVASCS